MTNEADSKQEFLMRKIQAKKQEMAQNIGWLWKNVTAIYMLTIKLCTFPLIPSRNTEEAISFKNLE